MSYGGVENTREDLEILQGATIKWLRIVSVAEQQADARKSGEEEFADFIDQSCLRMHVQFRKGLIVNDSAEGTFEIWQDVEGNGPGYIAFTGP
jgi:hypothetical protein